MPQTIRPRNIPCTIQNCNGVFANRSGLANHLRTHRKPRANPPDIPAQVVPDLLDGRFVEDFPMADPLQEEPQMPDRPTNGCEKVEYHPLINGMSFFFVLF